MGPAVTVMLNSGLAKFPAPTVTLVGDNIEIYNSVLFLLCYERSISGLKQRLVLHIRDKLTGFLYAEKVLKDRANNFEGLIQDPSFSDAMEVGHILVSLPHSGKIVVAKGKHFIWYFQFKQQP